MIKLQTYSDLPSYVLDLLNEDGLDLLNEDGLGIFAGPKGMRVLKVGPLSVGNCKEQLRIYVTQGKSAVVHVALLRSMNRPRSKGTAHWRGDKKKGILEGTS
jgi:hypothetical protein